MSATFLHLAGQLALVVAWGLILLLGLLGFGRLLHLLPVSADRRSRIARLYPSVMIAVVVLYTLMAVGTLFADYPVLLPLALLVALAGLGTLFWTFARDVLSGIVLRAEGTCELGRSVQIGDVRGQIISLGPRALGLETQGGDIAFVPYGEVSRRAIVQTSGAEQLAARTFKLELPDGQEPARVAHHLQIVALRCHWAAIGRDPFVVVRPDGLEMTVYAVDAAHLPEVETAVRNALASYTTH